MLSLSAEIEFQVLTIRYQCLDFTARGLVHPILTHGGLEDINRFCEDMNAGKLPGRAVIKIAA